MKKSLDILNPIVSRWNGSFATKMSGKIAFQKELLEKNTLFHDNLNKNATLIYSEKSKALASLASAKNKSAELHFNLTGVANTLFRIKSDMNSLRNLEI